MSSCATVLFTTTYLSTFSFPTNAVLKKRTGDPSPSPTPPPNIAQQSDDDHQKFQAGLRKRQAGDFCPASAPYYFGTQLCGTTSFCQSNQYRECTANPLFPYLSLGDCTGCYATGSYTQFVGLSTTSPASATTTSVSPVTSSYTSTITSVSCVSVSTSSASSPSRTSSSILASSTTSGSHTTFSSKATSSVASTPSSTSNTVQSSTSGAIASENHKSSFPVAAVAGGVAGGLVLIAVVAIIAYFCLRRNNDKSPYQPPPVMTQSVPSKPAFGGTTRSNAGTTENGGNFYGTGQLPYAAVPSAPQDYYTPSIPNYANYPYNHNDNADRLYEAPYNGPSEIPYVSSPSYIPASLLPGSLAGGPLYSQGNPALDSAAFGSLGGFVAPHPVDRGSRDLPEAVTIDDRDSRNLSG